MIQDLSKIHQPLGKLGSLPKNAEEWEKYRLTDDQVAEFDRQGYLAGIRVLDDEQIEILREELARLMEKSHPGIRCFMSTTPMSPRIRRQRFSMRWARGESSPDSMMCCGARRF